MGLSYLFQERLGRVAQARRAGYTRRILRSTSSSFTFAGHLIIEAGRTASPLPAHESAYAGPRGRLRKPPNAAQANLTDLEGLRRICCKSTEEGEA